VKLNSLKWVWLSVIIVILDQLTKQFIIGEFTLYESVRIIPGLNITYVQNTGAAFSFLRDAGGWQRWFFIVVSGLVSISLVFWLYNLPALRRWLAIALSLILGGAVGNLVDRFMYGYVIDFIDAYYQRWHWPAFNVADSAISIGVVMLIIDTFWFDYASVSVRSGEKRK
jgi:signal peptidase II